MDFNNQYPKHPTFGISSVATLVMRKRKVSDTITPR